MSKKPRGRAKKEIWHTFLKNEERDFVKVMGYGKEEIKRIGWQKFIEANGWRDVSDVKKWRTDALRIVICTHCRVEFAIYEGDNNMGICDKCLPKFDLDRFFKMYEDFNKVGEFEKAETLYRGFLIYPGVRRDFFKDKTEGEVKGNGRLPVPKLQAEVS